MVSRQLHLESHCRCTLELVNNTTTPRPGLAMPAAMAIASRANSITICKMPTKAARTFDFYHGNPNLRWYLEISGDAGRVPAEA